MAHPHDKKHVPQGPKPKADPPIDQPADPGTVRPLDDDPPQQGPPSGDQTPG